MSATTPSNIRTATKAELEARPEIGPVIARQVIEGRPYRPDNGPDRAKGTGNKRQDAIRPPVTAE